MIPSQDVVVFTQTFCAHKCWEPLRTSIFNSLLMNLCIINNNKLIPLLTSYLWVISSQLPHWWLWKKQVDQMFWVKLPMADKMQTLVKLVMLTKFQQSRITEKPSVLKDLLMKRLLLLQPLTLLVSMKTSSIQRFPPITN